MQLLCMSAQRYVSLAVAALLVLVASAATSAWAQAVAPATPAMQVAKIPMAGAGFFGSTLEMYTEVFKPAGPGPYPVLVYAHGRAGTPQERSALSEVVPRQFMSFWIARGFAVVAPARPGYGKTGGNDREIPGHSWDWSGNCSGAPDPERVASAASAAIRAAIDWTRAQPWAVGAKLVVAGNSVGGLTAVALSAANPPSVVAYINFAGGVAGNPDRSPGKSCAPEKVRESFAAYGKTARAPSLWLYAPNDKYWGPDVPRQWHAAFVASGSAAEFFATPPVPNSDGHALIHIGRDLWAPVVERFLKRVGLE